MQKINASKLGEKKKLIHCIHGHIMEKPAKDRNFYL